MKSTGIVRKIDDKNNFIVTQLRNKPMQFLGNAQWAFRRRAMRAPTDWAILKLLDYS